MIKAIFFDLDGTLLPMDENTFIKAYFGLMCKHMSQFGYEADKLVDTIWKGTYAMYKNDGIISNEDIFWNYFASVYGEDKLLDKPKFDVFYENGFLETKSICGDNPLAKKIIDFCKANVEYVILSTNPIFPYVGTKNRMGFVGLKPDDFDFVTAYENFSFCKPNPKYFMEILKKFNLKPDEVILFGNNTLEDGECALACGIKCYLVEGNIIYNPKATHEFEIIKMDEIIPTIEKELAINK